MRNILIGVFIGQAASLVLSWAAARIRHAPAAVRSATHWCGNTTPHGTHHYGGFPPICLGVDE